MDLDKIEALLTAVTEIVHENEPFKDKVAAIKSALSDDDRVNLAEFLSWFDDDLDE